MQSQKRSKPRVMISFVWQVLFGNWQSWLPTRGNVLFTLLVVSALFGVQSAGALPSFAPTAANTSTNTISYQGYLAGSDGNPVNNTLDFVFRLYDTETGGTALWSETHSNITVSNGLFSVLLGSITPISEDIFANNNNLWLGIAIGADEEMVPREKMTSTPYAMVSSNIPDNSITSDKLAANSVGSTAVSNNSLTASDLGPNSVNNGEIADGAVSSEKLNLSSGKACLSQEASTWSSGGYGAALFNLSKQFTLPEKSSVLVWIDGTALFSASGEVGVGLWVNNSNLSLDMNYDTNWFSVNSTRIIDLNAGTHTLKVGAVSDKSGTVKLHAGGGNQTCINYLVLGQQ